MQKSNIMIDYHFDEAKVVMQELIEDVASRVRARKKVTYILPLAIVMKAVYINNIL